MKKVGIITYQKTLNYGATLQNYALTKYLSRVADVETINYHNEKIEKNEFKYVYMKNIKSLKDFIKFLFLHKKIKRKYNNFKKFYNKNIKNSTEHYDKNTITLANENYENFLVGSDQIWNFDLNNQDYNYLLEFAKEGKKRYSYSASFGYSNLPNEYLKKTSELIEKMTTLNVREKSGQDIIKNNFHKNSNVTIDPTFLLDYDEWNQIADINQICQKYIFIYMIDFNKNIIDKIIEIAKKNNYMIISISDSMKYMNKIKYIRDASPEKFLGLIKNAEYIITGSFHAVCFSINFRKNFYYIKKKNSEKNTRLDSILELTNLVDRDFTKIKNVDELTNIEYQLKNLEDEIEKSKKIINDMFEKVK